MEEVRQLVQEEGREARNLVAFHVAVDTPARFTRKPPRALPLPRRAPPRPAASRLRSASAGRDKRSELRARYWALLFGDLQRAIGEIYNTVEAHENLNECQEVILVLENYTRDFKALGEWFRLKWEYDNTPPPQRPQSLAWEIRKTDFVRPESRRTQSVKSSPSVSGKNSPCLSGHNTPSGKNSPSLTGKASPASGKISPRVSSGHSTSPKANMEFFSNKIAASKVTAKPEPKLETKLTEIKEKEVNDSEVVVFIEEKDEKVLPVLQVQGVKDETVEVDNPPAIELGKAKQCPNASPKLVVVKSTKSKAAPKNARKEPTEELSAQAKATKATLDAIENDFLAKQFVESKAKNENMLNQDIEVENQIAKNNSAEDKLATPENITVKEKDIVSELLKDNCFDQIEQTKADVENIKNTLPSSNAVNSIEMNGKIDTPIEKDSSSSESPSKSDDNFADISNESSIKSVEDKQEKVDVTSEFVVEEKPIIDPKPIEREKNTESDVAVEKKTAIALLKENLETSKDKESNKNKDDSKDDKDFKKPEPKVEAKPHTKPAYSQAAAKPKVIPAKTEIKTPTRASPLIRSKTAVEIRSNTAPKIQRQFPKGSQTSKCSYPFNLTTGRPSLFDTSSNAANKGAVPKKVVNKNVQMGAGDAKVNQPKLDPKKRPLRPTTLKVNEKGDKKDKANPALEKIKDCDEYSSSDTIVTQIDMSRIESSESLRTLVPDDLEVANDAANSVEVLNVDSNKNDNDGWLTVKSRRLSRESKKHSKSHWANRFHQPSATTSLPTLNMIESPKQEVKPIIHAPVAPKVDRAKSEQPQTVRPEKIASARNRADTRRNLDMIRQKSDVTGLKRSARSKALLKKAEKAKDSLEDAESSELTKNRLHSSLESLTTGLARSQESTEEAFDFDKWKAEFKSTFKYLEDDDQMPNHNEILRTADPSEMSEIAEMTSQIEENEKKISWALDFQSEVDQRKLSEEEDLLNRQIRELQQVSDIDLDTETDDTETDAEILCEEISVPAPDNLGALAASLEDQYETALAGMSWAERVDTLVVLQALVARDPGNLAVHQYETALAGMSWAERVDTLVVLQALVARDPGNLAVHQYETALAGMSWAERADTLVLLQALVARDPGNLAVHQYETALAGMSWAERADTLVLLQALVARDPGNLAVHQYETALAGMSWAERADTLVLLQALVARDPGNLAVHQYETALAGMSWAERADTLVLLQALVARDPGNLAVHQYETALAGMSWAERADTLVLLQALVARDPGNLAVHQYETALAGMSWAERADTLVLLQALVARDPGRAQQLHEKLSQGIKRRGSFQDALRRLQAKQARAERQRLEYQTERAKRIHQLLARVEEVKVAKNQLIEEKRMRMERRLQKAAENRDQHLKDIVRKAHDEEEKLREIAFIKQLEAENRRHEFLDQCSTHTTRLRRVRRDRLNKLEQKAAREAAVGARRQAIEAARQRHVLTLLERRAERDRRIDGLREMRRQERDMAAREKAEGVKSRLSALAAAAELEAVALRSRIRDKQDASQQRLESHLQAIREKATGPRPPTTSESQEPEGEGEEAARREQERRRRDKLKALKKKARKVKQKLLAGGNELTHSENRVPIDPYTFPVANKMYKVVQQINNILAPLIDQKPPLPEEPEDKVNGEDDAENKKPKKKKNGKKEASENNNNTELAEKVNEDAKESKKSKKKKKEERAKLGTESVCSSLSDMSRASGKSEKKNKVVIDMQYLERLLNELLRMLEKSDTASDKAMFKKLQGPKTVGQLLALAADRPDLAHLFTTKCLSTAVTISSRGLATSSESARYLINTNTCVYIVKLLSMQVEKDLSDPREAELACFLADWVSLALDSTLQEDRAVNQATRARGHLLISYICLSGVLRADTRGEVRAGIQTLVTVCCDLCTPYENHHSPECFAASQSLHVALGRGLCGARADFCVLFARGANLAECGGFVRAARTAHLLRTIAQLDHQLVQESFMEGGYALEFRAAVARLLTQHAPSEKEAPRTQAHTQSTMRLDHSLSETMVLDLIILIGFMVVNNPQLQETICTGWSVIKMLCTLPANWLVSRAHSHVLLPTLTALAQHAPARLAIRAELSPQMLDEYMESPEAQRVKLVQVIKQGRSKKLATTN